MTRRFLDESGLALGDEVTFRGASDGEKDAGAGEEDATADASSTEVFSRQTYTICGVVLDPTDINAGNGTMSFRASGGSQYAFFVLPSAVTTDVYTAVYLRVDGAESPPMLLGCLRGGRGRRQGPRGGHQVRARGGPPPGQSWTTPAPR